MLNKNFKKKIEISKYLGQPHTLKSNSRVMKTKVCYPNTGQFRYSDSDEHLDKQAKPNTKQTKKKGCYLKINTQKTYLWNKSVKSPSNICLHFKYDAANWGRVQT